MLELICSNPAASVKIPKGAGEKQFKRAYKTAEEAQQILDAFRGHELYPIVYMTLFYGYNIKDASFPLFAGLCNILYYT